MGNTLYDPVGFWLCCVRTTRCGALLTLGDHQRSRTIAPDPIIPPLKTPTHDAIARQAHELWQDRGCPNGSDSEIWLEAERQLAGGEEAQIFNARAAAETAAESQTEYYLPSTMPQQQAIQAALQKQSARAPQMAPPNGPKPQPPETGKPLWDKPSRRNAGAAHPLV